MMNIPFISIAHAVAINAVSMNIPGTNPSTGSDPGVFVANFYQFALMIGGVLAFGVVVYGGIRYMASAGNPSGQGDAKEWIEAALLGLLLLVGAYFVLNVVNPRLTTLSLPPLQPVSIAPQSTGACSNVTCPPNFLPTPVGTGGNNDTCACQNAKGAQGCGGTQMGTVANSCGDGQTCCKIQVKITDPVTYSCFSSCLQAPASQGTTGTIQAAPCGDSGTTCDPATQRCCTTNYLLFKSSSCKPLTTSC